MCWPLSDGSSKFIPIDEQPNHQIVRAFHLGKAQRTTNQPLDPGPEIDVLALDFLRVLLAYVMLLDIDMPLIDLLYLSTLWLWWQAVAGMRGVTSSHALRSNA